MDNYTKVIYGNREKTSYPEKLMEKLIWEYAPNYEQYAISSAPIRYRVLDLGCGDMTFTKELQNRFHFVHGLESEFVFFTYMKEGKIFEVKKSLKTDFNRKLPYKENSFDFIFCKSVIEHVLETERFLKEVLRILKPGGRVLVLTPSWEHNYKDFYNDFTHVKPFHRKGLQDALKINGFQKVEVKYFYHLPWIWKKPYLLFLAKFLSLFSSWKWKDKEETRHRVNIRFSQEIQLLGTAYKL